MLAARLAYARKGIRTSPADTAKKKPHLKGWQQKATTNPQQITAEANRWPDAGILTPTGSSDRLMVMDEDVPGGLEGLEEELGIRLRGITTEVGTPSGLTHAHFSLPEGTRVGNSVGKHVRDGHEGLDVRGEGGMVLLPPTPGYSFANNLPMAEAPPELIEWARSRKKPATATYSTLGVVPELEDGEAVPKHSRNAAMVSILGRAHDGTRGISDLISHGLAVRDASFEKPYSFPDAEVEKIARWTIGKDPCKARKKREPNTEVEEALEACSRYWYTERLPGGGRSKLRDVYRACLKSAARRSEMGEAVTGDGEVVRGPAFSDSCRQIAEVANTSAMSVSRNLNRMAELGTLAKIEAPEGLAHTYVLTQPETTPRTGVTPPGQPPPPSTGARLARGVTVARADELTVPFFGWRSPVGNSRSGAWSALEAFGSQTEEGLAELLGISRPRDVRRRLLEPLSEMGAAVSDGGLWSLAEDHEHLADALWREPYATVSRRRARSRTDEGRMVTTVDEHVTVASDAERVEAMKERHRKERQEFAALLEEVADRADEELRQEEEIRGLLNAWDDERQALSFAGADGFVAELESVEEAAHLTAVGAEGVEALVAVADAQEVQDRHTRDTQGVHTEWHPGEAPEPRDLPRVGHTADTPPTHRDPSSRGTGYYRDTTDVLPSSELAKALAGWLERNPGDHPDCRPPEGFYAQCSWLASTVSCYELVEGPRPDPLDVAAALGELARSLGTAA